MVATDAQKRAQRKYDQKQKQWLIRIPPDLYDEIEKTRQKKNLTRKQLLIDWLQNNKT